MRQPPSLGDFVHHEVEGKSSHSRVGNGKSRRDRINLALHSRWFALRGGGLHLWEDTLEAIRDVVPFFRLYTGYIHKRLRLFAWRFEDLKDFLVTILISKRGRYSHSFLNVSVVILASTAVIGAPVIASNYPGVDTVELSQFTPPSAVVSPLDQSELGTATQISAKPRDQVVTYTVQQGDTLAKIAEVFGVTVDTIKWASKLEGESLKIGQELKIPPVTGVVHTVREGDTVYTVAKKYKTDPQKIVNFPFNDFADLETFALSVGQSLVVPDGVIPEAPAIARAQPVPQIVPGPPGTYIWPSQGIITQYPVWYHMALDIANASGPVVYAARSGKVVYSSCIRWGYGCHVIVDHGDGYQTLYGHLSRLDVEVGARVGQGTTVGRMGSTGRSTGTHLHFEVRRNGVTVNPLPFLQQ